MNSSLNRLAGKVAVITGSTRGIGRAMARVFAAEGAKVLICGRSDGSSIAAAIRASGGEAIYQRADVCVETDVRELFSTAERHWGRLDILVNNAAPLDFMAEGGESPVEHMPTENWEYMQRAGTTSAFWACKYAVPLLRRSGGGAIVNISSMASWRALKSQPAYSASKAALNALSRQVAIDYAKDNIRSNAIIIGFVLSGDRSRQLADDPVIGPGLRGMSLLPTGTSEDVAYAALFLASDETRFITGVELPVDGGLLIRSLVPEYLDK